VTGHDLSAQRRCPVRLHYLPPDFDVASDLAAREAYRSEPFIIIDCRPHQDIWRAFWTDKISLLGRFEGTREQAIAWARKRCDATHICADPDDENAQLIQLGPDDE